MTAMRVHNLLANGAGGLDWAGLPIVCAWLGVADPEGLMQRLSIIKLHRPPEQAEPQAGLEH